MLSKKILALAFVFSAAAQARPAHTKAVGVDDPESTSLCPDAIDRQEIVRRAASTRKFRDAVLATRVEVEARWAPAKRELARAPEFDADRATVADKQKILESKRAVLAALKPGWLGRVRREQPPLQAEVDRALADYNAAVDGFDRRVEARLPSEAQASLSQIRGQFFDANVEAEVAESQLTTLKKFDCL